MTRYSAGKDSCIAVVVEKTFDLLLRFCGSLSEKDFQQLLKELQEVERESLANSEDAYRQWISGGNED